MTDEHAIQLAEFVKREAQREQQQELLRANLEFTQASNAQAAELKELRARNEELMKHVTELEVDLQHSDTGAIPTRGRVRSRELQRHRLNGAHSSDGGGKDRWTLESARVC